MPARRPMRCGGSPAETKGLIKEIRDSNGTLMKFIRDDDLHGDVKALVAKTDRAVDGLEKQVNGLSGFVKDGRETLRSVRQGTDALGRLPIVRGYVENSTALMVRPNHDVQDVVLRAEQDLSSRSPHGADRPRARSRSTTSPTR